MATDDDLVNAADLALLTFARQLGVDAATYPIHELLESAFVGLSLVASRAGLSKTYVFDREA